MGWKILLVTLSILPGAFASTKESPPWSWSKSRLELQKDESYDWDLQEKLNETQAQTFIADRIRALTNLVDPEPDPYTGTISLPEACRHKNLPATIKKSGNNYLAVAFSLYASGNLKDRPVIGNCHASLIKTQYLFLYCRKSRKLLTLRYFYSDLAPWLTEPIASCSN